MTLFVPQGKTETMKIWDKRGIVAAEATVIFAMALKYIKDHLMGHFKESGK